MNKLDQLRLEVRRLAKRVDVLEARRPRHKPAAPKPTDAIVGARRRLWAQYIFLDLSHRGRITYVSFAAKYHLGHPCELSRFFNCTGRRGIAEGSATAVRFYRALHNAISEAQARKVHGPDFHGIIADSHSSAARPQ